MKISARNAFQGKVVQVKPGAVYSVVEFSTSGGARLVGTITNESAQALGMVAGREAVAYVKASSVLVMTDGTGMKLSARNCLPGHVSHVTDGPVSTAVSIVLAGGETVHATITHESSVDLGLKSGLPATAVFKASALIFAVPA